MSRLCTRNMSTSLRLGFNSGYLYQVGIRPSLASERMLLIPVAFAALVPVNLNCAASRART